MMVAPRTTLSKSGVFLPVEPRGINRQYHPLDEARL
jgi:hypothetical protein